MAYKPKEIEKIFSSICDKIEEGKPVRQILKEEKMPSSKTFFKWLDEDESKVKRYARACDMRADAIFDDMFAIADDGTNDYIEVDIGDDVKVQKLNQEHIQRSRLRIDTRKWALSKMIPKKYGDKLDITTKDESINDLSSKSTEDLIKRAGAIKKIDEQS